MRKSESIFDLSSLDDLPCDCKKEIRLVSRERVAQNKLIELFNIKETLSLNEMIVGMYRVHGEIRSRSWFVATLYNLGKSGFSEKIDRKKGVYRKKDIKNENK